MQYLCLLSLLNIRLACRHGQIEERMKAAPLHAAVKMTKLCNGLSRNASPVIRKKGKNRGENRHFFTFVVARFVENNERLPGAHCAIAGTKGETMQPAFSGFLSRATDDDATQAHLTRLRAHAAQFLRRPTAFFIIVKCLPLVNSYFGSRLAFPSWLPTKIAVYLA